MTASDPAPSANPLLTLTFEAPFDRVRAEHVEPAIETLLARSRQAIEAVVTGDGGPRTYQNTLAALERATEHLEWASGLVAHLESVATYPALREAHQAIQPRLSRFWTDLVLDSRLWTALTTLADSDAGRGLTGAQRRHLTKTIDEFRRQGAELDAAGKAQIAEINAELAELTTTFAQHVLDATNAFELIITDETTLAGLPPSARDAAAESARAKGVDGWRFTLQAPSLVPVLTYLDDRTVREALWRAHATKAAAAPFDNRPIVDRILALRREKATILGYTDFSDLVLEDRMAGSGARAAEFIGELSRRTQPFFARENEALTAAPGAAEVGTFEPWDIGYYAEKLRAAEYAFDEEELRPYFSADRVLSGLFEIVRRLYGVTVTALDDWPTWDPQVRTYDLRDEDGTELAVFYVDLHPRENKRGGAWMDGLVLAVPPHRHLALICANVTPPTGDKPALLTHREVETLFHEFGHLLHYCLSAVPVRSLGGTNVAWDFVELPSQIMENWCWEREALDLFARHYVTDDPIPDVLLEKMQRARTFRAANAQMRQVGFATVDLCLHRDYDPSRDGSVNAYVRRVLERHVPTPLPDDYAFIDGFTHLFANAVGYAAGYYSYKWSEVLDADAFTRFRDAGIFDRSTGEAFREAVLATGDSEPPQTLYARFMGREPEVDALFYRQGLVDGDRAAATA